MASFAHALLACDFVGNEEVLEDEDETSPPGTTEYALWTCAESDILNAHPNAINSHMNRVS